MVTLNPHHRTIHALAALKAVAIVLLLLSATSLKAQNAGNSNTLTFSAGAAIPVGNFRYAAPQDLLAGYAKFGELANVSFEHVGKKHIGFAAMLYGQTNPLNTGAFENQFSSVIFFYNPAQNGSFRSYGNWSFQKKSWFTESLLAGLSGEWPLKNSKISFVSKALAGLCYVQAPALHATSISDTAFVIFNQNGASAFGVSFLVAGGLKYKLGSKLCLLLQPSYFGTNIISFKNVTTSVAATNGGLIVPGVYTLANSKQPPIVTSSTATNKQPIGVVDINLGIVLAL